MNNSINLANDKIENAKFGYQMALQMVEILGEEIYSRFNAMLTANSIIIAAYVLIFSENNKMPDFLRIFLPIFGIILCVIWIVYILTGIYRQRQYRSEAKRIEKEYFNSTFKLLNFDYSKDPCLIKCFRFKGTSISVIIIFVLLHLTVLLYLCHKLLFVIIR